ncbi:transposase [Streptomyces sp. NPDC054854]
MEDAQVAVHLLYAGRSGHAAVDRELYVPRSCSSDPDRCRAAGRSEEASFATNPELAARLVARFLDAGHRVAWVTGDEVYGGNPKLRTSQEERGTGYVLALACSHEATGAGKSARTPWPRRCPSEPGRSSLQGSERRATGPDPGILSLPAPVPLLPAHPPEQAYKEEPLAMAT